MIKNISSQARLLLYVGLLFVLVHHNVFAQNGTGSNDHARKIQEMLAQAHKYRLFNGAALVAENGKVIYKGAFGMANMEWGIANTPDTKFRLGSITKQFTSMLILQLVEQGKVKLDAKISDYLPDYRKDIGQKVTVHQLLTHTSGIPSYTGLPNFFQDVSRNPYKVDDFVKKYASGDLEFEPGSKFAYNNSGYFLLGGMGKSTASNSIKTAAKFSVVGFSDP
jgi:CubicO group peptidase (beta-lactamase class C family)